MLQIAANWIEQEKKDIEEAKEAYMEENCPAPDLCGDQAALMVRMGRAGNEHRDGGEKIGNSSLRVFSLISLIL